MIRAQDEPSGGRNVIEAALASRDMYTPDSPEWRVGRPIPLYRLGTLAEPTSLMPLRPRRIGWSYPTTKGGRRGLATVVTRSKRLIFAGITESSFAALLFVAAELAEESLAGEATTYKPRILDVAALRVTALWLFSRRRSRFVVLRGTQLRGEAKLELHHDIRPHLADAAARLKDAQGFQSR